MTGYGGTETVIKNLYESRKLKEQPFNLRSIRLVEVSTIHGPKMLRKT